MQYIDVQDTIHKGWRLVNVPPDWVTLRLFNAVDDPSIKQGHHYYPYCRGNHYEYYFDTFKKQYYHRLRRDK
jgi:hypothetical protein